MMQRWHRATAEATAGGETRSACGYSSVSVEDAKAEALAAAQKAAERAANGTISHDYPYGVRPLVEPVLREWRREDGALSGLLTINARGCVVLNTAAVMFVDVDLPKPPKPAGGLLGGLFGRKPPPPAPSPAEPALQKLRAFVDAYPEWGFRVYRTAAGLRYLCTSALHEPAAPESLAVLAELGSDPLYIRLCEKQESFRARLTPKPWRVDKRAYRQHYAYNSVVGRNRPFALAEAGAAPKTDYEKKAAQFAVCHFLEKVGSANVHPEAQALATVHDQYTRPDTQLPLA